VTWLLLALLGVAVFTIPVWLPRWSRWLDTRQARRAAERRMKPPLKVYPGGNCTDHHRHWRTELDDDYHDRHDAA
jgi:hypothetical protein